MGVAELIELERVDVRPNLRKLVTVRMIDAVDPIAGADAIQVATIGGWKVVVKKGEFAAGDNCVYFEIDSFLPEGNPAWQFLVDKQPKIFNGVKGHKLRTVKLRGQISQGLALPITALPEMVNELDHAVNFEAVNFEELRQVDFSDVLGVVKYEPPLPAQLAGKAAGLFPSFIRKTDQERCQNLRNEIFGYEETLVPLNILPELLDEVALTSGRVKVVGGEAFSVRPAKADRDDAYEISIKLDGSSMTAFTRLHPDGLQEGVCSRNLELKVGEENADNTFVSVYQKSGLQTALRQLTLETGKSYAVQGEIMGPAIQGNREQFKDFKFFVFDVYDIEQGFYLPPMLRMDVFKMLVERGAKIEHVPVIYTAVKLGELGLDSIDKLLAFAEGPSITNQVREGLVFKRIDGQFSFKAISNKYLANQKED